MHARAAGTDGVFLSREFRSRFAGSGYSDSRVNSKAGIAPANFYPARRGFVWPSVSGEWGC